MRLHRYADRLQLRATHARQDLLLVKNAVRFHYLHVLKAWKPLLKRCLLHATHLVMIIVPHRKKCNSERCVDLTLSVHLVLISINLLLYAFYLKATILEDTNGKGILIFRGTDLV